MSKYVLHTTKKPKTPFSLRLGNALMALGISQKRLSESGGVSPPTISAYLSGQSQPAADVLANWVRDFAINANWLLTGEGEMLLGGPTQSSSQVPSDESSRNLSPAQREMLTYKRIQTELGMQKSRIAEGVELIIRGWHASGKMDPRNEESDRMDEMFECAEDDKTGKDT